LVIDPCRRLSPEERSEEARPVKLMNCSAVLKRWKSPTSTTRPIAVSVSMPRMHRNRAISSLCGPSLARASIASSNAAMRRSI
jgi:hypothetical protein